MSSSILVNKASLTLESTQQALNMLRNMRQKRKKENPASIYDLIKSIYVKVRGYENKDGKQGKESKEMISSGEYLGTQREGIEDMLGYIREKIDGKLGCNIAQTDGEKLISTKHIVNPQPPQPLESPQTLHLKKTVQTLKKTLQQKQHQIATLLSSSKSAEAHSKSIQLKLLNNIKRLDLQVRQLQQGNRVHQVQQYQQQQWQQQQEVKIRELVQKLEQKEMELDQMVKLNQRKHRMIRKLEEDLYDLQMELQERNQELEAERECADFLERKVSKILQQEVNRSVHYHDQLQTSYISQQTKQKNHHTTRKITTQIGIQTTPYQQTPTDSPHHPKKLEPTQPPTQTDNHPPHQHQQQQQTNSQCNSSILTESKENKYLESIQRLTHELGEAYKRINQLMKNGQVHGDGVQRNQIILKAVGGQINPNPENLGNGKDQVSGGNSKKVKSKSSYFSRFWK